MIYPQAITEDHRESKKQLFKQIVETSGIPEIAFGLKTEGNMASVEENMKTLSVYIEAKRIQNEENMKELLQLTYKLRVLADTGAFVETDGSIEWNEFEVMSEKVKSEIFANFAKAISTMSQTATITNEQIHKLFTESDFEKWKTGIFEKIKENTKSKMAFEDISDFNEET